MLYGRMRHTVRFDKDVGRRACGRDSRGMPGAVPDLRDQGQLWSKCDWARPPDITSSAWEGGTLQAVQALSDTRHAVLCHSLLNSSACYHVDLGYIHT